MVNIIDVSEENWGRKVLSILLQDKTTKKNIIWATDDYESLGFDYKAFNQIQENMNITVVILIYRKRIVILEGIIGN